MKKILFLILSLFGLNACAQDKGYRDMDTEAFAKYIAESEVQLLDVRTPEEYAEDHIPGAKNINVFDSDFIDEAEKWLEKSRPVAVYCRSGKRSADAARKLTAKGYRVVNLDGGILAWEQAGEPIAK